MHLTDWQRQIAAYHNTLDRRAERIRERKGDPEQIMGALDTLEAVFPDVAQWRRALDARCDPDRVAIVPLGTESGALLRWMGYGLAPVTTDPRDV